jgi:hypothetical protein
MKRIIIGLTAALALAFVGVARADDTKSTDKSSTQKSSDATKEASPYGSTDTSKEGTGGSGMTTKGEKKSTKDKDATKADDATKTPAPAK